MSWVSIANAILLETIFKVWCGENYELFHDPRGSFIGIGSPREIFITRLPRLMRQARLELLAETKENWPIFQ